METARSATTYSRAHSLSDGRQNDFICLSLVSCKAVCVLCFIKGLRLGSIKEGPCLPCSSFCSPGYTERAGTLLLLGHRALRKAGWEERLACTLVHTNLLLGALPGPPSFILEQEQGSCGDLIAATVPVRESLFGQQVVFGSSLFNTTARWSRLVEGMQNHALLLNIR